MGLIVFFVGMFVGFFLGATTIYAIVDDTIYSVLKKYEKQK